MLTKNKLLLIVLAALVLWPTHGQAAKATKPAGLSLSPFEQQISIAPDDPDKSFTLTLTNHTASLQELKLSARDFGSLNETGGLLLEGSSQYTQKYGLASWLSLGADTVLLQPGESRGVLVTVQNRTSLQPGGHYGAVVASVDSLTDETDNHVAINQQLLSLVLVNKVGGEHYDLKLSTISHNGNWLHLPTTVKLRFQNPGNIHVIPRGVVRLKSPGGTVLATGIINSESAFILPETFRELYVPLTPVGKAVPWPGLYHIEVEYRYDGLTRSATKRQTLHFIDLGLYLLALLLLLVGGWAFWRYRRRTTTTS
jgi:hypothetical protein